MKKSWFLLIFALIALGPARLPGETCTAAFVREPPRLDSPVWKTAPAYSLTRLPRFGLRFPPQVQFAWTATDLWFRFEVRDDDLVDEAPEGQESGLYLFADAIELFARPEGSRGYWEFHFTAGGKFGAIHFPSRGKRMPSNVRYLPMPGLACAVERDGTLNEDTDHDRSWCGLARIPFAGIAGRCIPFRPGTRLEIQVASVGYSVWADQDERALLHYAGGDDDSHNLANWVSLEFQP